MAKIVSIVPYKFLPPVNGGHWGVIIIEKLLSIFNEVHTISTANNIDEKKYPFHTHLILNAKPAHYLPFAGYKAILKVAKEQNAGYIFLHHPYMYFTAKKVADTLGIPLYIRSHNIESERFRSLGKSWWRIMHWYEKMAYKKADRTFFVTEEDKDWAIAHFNIKKEQGVVMPFGIDFAKSPELPKAVKHKTAEESGLNGDVPWLFFMGQLDYKPNEEAVLLILKEVLPRLRKSGIPFQVLIFGKNLHENIQQEIKQSAAQDDIVYLGFVPELAPMLSSCDVMLNPVLSGGGVKTKLVESLAWNKTVISTDSGALGMEKSVCGEKLRICADKDWDAFASLALQAMQGAPSQIPDAYFQFYYANNIAERMQPHFS
jgi:glycosyltransferase involved in cell wall biosynthesis